jgi:hypothetical protein
MFNYRPNPQQPHDVDGEKNGDAIAIRDEFAATLPRVAGDAVDVGIKKTGTLWRQSCWKARVADDAVDVGIKWGRDVTT